MINVLLVGVGGQGIVLAAKVLAQAAQNKGWKVRTAETIGMAQRGGSVTSHLRMGKSGEEVHAPLLACGTADLVIAFEPGEAARALPYLAQNGMLVTAQTTMQPVTAALSKDPYRAEDVACQLRQVLGAQLVMIDETAVLAKAAAGRKALNMVLLAAALAQNRVPLTVDDLKQAVRACVKPQFVDMNVAAIDAAVALL